MTDYEQALENLSIRARYALARAYCEQEKLDDRTYSAGTAWVDDLLRSLTPGRLAQFSRTQLLRVPNVGVKTVREIQEVLGELGLSLTGADRAAPMGSDRQALKVVAFLARQGGGPWTGTLKGLPFSFYALDAAVSRGFVTKAAWRCDCCNGVRGIRLRLCDNSDAPDPTVRARFVAAVRRTYGGSDYATADGQRPVTTFSASMPHDETIPQT